MFGVMKEEAFSTNRIKPRSEKEVLSNVKESVFRSITKHTQISPKRIYRSARAAANMFNVKKKKPGTRK